MIKYSRMQKEIPSWLVCVAPVARAWTVRCSGFKSPLGWDCFSAFRSI